ncbi:uncharacterized protein GGS25DRAFT_524304 [Hypoxylon fragiforme]|uniref:uncharacterized protein n=1 Tax=Hypoxylon fragiforme TaxID=63214 RepID=UPI0020C6BE01|nr:uncharacterized protein GGS25DRAFT_524304 [Hypoxylon fragiforme]KAI2604810.1 hypothetical protein GGS25DRAFT_524304 [Hypoxylon fragiforme]
MLLPLLHLAQAALALYGGVQSYLAITNLHKYESASSKLASVSSTAEHQRSKTYATQTSGAASLLSSLLSSLLLAYQGSGYGIIVRYGIQVGMVVGLFFARGHMTAFWGDKKISEGWMTVGKLPEMGEYEEARRRTARLLDVLDVLMFSWAATWMGAVVLGY